MNDDIVPAHFSTAQQASPSLAAIPTTLKSEKAWLLWRKVPKEKDPSRFDKVPHYANGKLRRGVQGTDIDRAQLVTFDEALKSLGQSKFSFNPFTGVGIASLPGSSWAALDLDNVAANEEARKLADAVAAVGGYIERSPSGKGLRGFVASTGLGSHKNNAIGVEIFEGSGFVTVTGDVVNPGDVVALPAEVTERIRGLLGNKSKIAAIDRTPPPEWTKYPLESLPSELCNELRAGYAQDEDRSKRLFLLCCKLARTGLSRDDAYRIVADADLPWLAPGLDRRGGDTERARDWVWRYGVQSAFAAEDSRTAELEQSRLIGIGEQVTPVPSPSMTLDDMLARYVYLTKSNEVCDLQYPLLAMGREHFQTFTASSFTELAHKDNPLKRKLIPTARLFLQDERRQMLETRTWHPGEGQFTHDPMGLRAVNVWTPAASYEPPADWQQRVQPFLAHVEYLIPVVAERERFLHWLAHIAQRPGEPVHSHYLMIAPGVQGVGRNWLACLLARVWAGATALSVSFAEILSGRFNAELSQKLLAVVDELHEGAAGSQWALAEAMKTELTRSHRKIKPKYGKEHIEFNCLRWLMFSNHLMALPLTEEDRRIWVIENPRVAREPEYYERLYASLDDTAFVLSVRHWLEHRDICGFRPGERPEVNEVKRKLINSVRSDEDAVLDHLVTDYPSDVISMSELQRRVFGGVVSFSDGGSQKRQAMLRKMLARVGAEAYAKPIKLDGRTVRVVILRNVALWRGRETVEIAEEVRKQEPKY